MDKVQQTELGPVCVCGALAEEVDSGDGYTYWAHVKRMRIEYDHAAVPQLADRDSYPREDPTAPLPPSVEGYQVGGAA